MGKIKNKELKESKEVLELESLLKENGYRVTAGRVMLLSFLKKSKKPLSVADIQNSLGNSLDRVTLYRALEDFSKSKIVVKINLNTSSAYYEYIHTGHHHHHIICEGCGKIEDITHCDQADIQKEILKHSKTFKKINSHSLEFFGICKRCDE